MCRFYGWTPDYVENMDYGKALEYWQAITTIEAQDFLISLEVSDWPNMKDQQRKKLHRERYAQAKIEDSVEKILKNDDLIGFLEGSI